MPPVKRIVGELIGERLLDKSGVGRERVVWIRTDHGLEGPAENSVILVQMSHDGSPRGRYLAWIIGYNDLDRASGAELDSWRVIEPPRPYEEDLSWEPFGWEPLEKVWRLEMPA